MLEQPPEHLLGLSLLALGQGVGVDALEHELPQGGHGLSHLRGLADGVLVPAGGDHVLHQGVDPLPVGEAQNFGDGQGDVHGVDDPAPEGVLNVVVDVGDLVSQADHLALQGGGLPALGVADDAVAHLPGEVQPLALLFQPVHHPQRLLVVGEAPGHDGVEQPLSGVAEGGVAQVVAQGDGLGQVLVQGEGPSDGPGDAVDLQGVGHAGAVVVPLRLEEYLGLVLQPPERLAVYDAVDVPLEAGADGTLLLRALAAAAVFGLTGAGAQKGRLHLLPVFPGRHRQNLLSHGQKPFYYNIRKNKGISFLVPKKI